MTHFPKNPECKYCNSAKATNKPHRKLTEQQKMDVALRGDIPVNFGDLITVDHFFTRHPSSRGIHNEECGMVVFDKGSKFIYVYGQDSNLEFYVQRDMIHFVGPKDAVRSFYTDRAPEFKAVAEALKWPRPTSTPFRSETNGVIEERNRRVLEGTRTALATAGFTPRWWPYAASHWAFSSNIRKRLDKETRTMWSPYFKRLKVEFNGLSIPFGARVQAKPPKNIKLPKMGETTVYGIFLGYETNPGGKWNGNYVVALLKSFEKGI